MSGESAEVVVCGAGIAGLSVAWQLAVRHGWRDVVVVDERPPLSLTSDKSTECYRNWWPDRPMVELMNRSIELFDELAAASGHFFLANSYDNLYKPSRAGEPENDAYMQKAIEWYKKAADKEPDLIYRQRAMQYLVAAYGPEKLNNPAEAEPIVQRMIQMDPSEYLNYLELSKIYENAGRYDEAEAQLLKAREVKPKQPEVYAALSAFYNRQGEFEKTVEALNTAADLQPDNPQGFQLVAVFFWAKAFKDKRLTAAQQKDYIAKGIDATDRALKLNPDHRRAHLQEHPAPMSANGSVTVRARRRTGRTGGRELDS